MAAAGQACFSGQGLPAVQAFPLNKIARVYTHRPKSTGRINLLLNKSLPAVQVHHQQKSTGCINSLYKSTDYINWLYKSTGCTKVYRLFISLPAIHKSTDCLDLLYKSTGYT